MHVNNYKLRWWEKIAAEYSYLKYQIVKWVQENTVSQRLVYVLNIDDKYINIPTDFTYNMDHSLAVFMDNAFTAFVAHNMAFPIGMEPEEWDDILLEIRDGFRAFHEYQTEAWASDWTMGEQMQRHQEALGKLRGSIDLMKTHWPSLSY